MAAARAPACCEPSGPAADATLVPGRAARVGSVHREVKMLHTPPRTKLLMCVGLFGVIRVGFFNKFD